MAFQFRFARLKSIRELEEDLAMQRLALARQEEQLQEEKLLLAKEQEDKAVAGFKQPHATAALTLSLEVRNCHDLANRTVQQSRVKQEAVQQTEQDREHLLLRMQKAKIMQSLYDRHIEMYQQQDALAEQKVLDELGGMQHLRNKRAGR